MLLQLADHAFLSIAAIFRTTAQSNPVPLYAVAAFAMLNMGLFYFTRGKEFAIGGFASALYLVPFLNI